MSCFETEHERLHNFQRCRDQKLSPWMHEHYPKIADLILSCTRKKANARPSAKQLVTMIASLQSFSTSSREKDLESQLVTKEFRIADLERELEAKDKTIAELRAQLAKAQEGSLK